MPYSFYVLRFFVFLSAFDYFRNISSDYVTHNDSMFLKVLALQNLQIEIFWNLVRVLANLEGRNLKIFLGPWAPTMVAPL